MNINFNYDFLPTQMLYRYRLLRVLASQPQRLTAVDEIISFIPIAVVLQFRLVVVTKAK